MAKQNSSRAFKAMLIGNRVLSNTGAAFSLYEKSRFGEIVGDRIQYSLVEAFYLLEKGKISIWKEKKKLTARDFARIAGKKDRNFSVRFSVFEDMRNKGYVVKTALKFGADFRVYEKGVKPGQEHAKWVLFAVDENSNLTWHEFAAKNRVAHSTRKNLLIGIVDEEGDVTYYEVGWVRP